MDINNNLPLVTVAMVTYNQESIIKQAIESVLAQGYQNFELIISDDCSKDKTVEIAATYKDGRIKIIVSDKNVYQYANRNKIINAAKGKYIIFVDGDDYLYTHGLEYLVKLFEGFPDCGAIFSHIYRTNIVFPAYYTSHQFLLAEYFDKSYLGTSLARAIFKVDALKAIGGFSTKYITSDEHIRINVAAKFPLLITDHHAIWWRISPKQESNRVDKLLLWNEKLQYTREIFNTNYCPLTEEEKFYALWKMENSIARNLIKNIITLKWNNALRLYKTFGLKLKNLKSPPRNKICKVIFPGNDYANPHIMPHEKNPLSVWYKSNFLF
jgi:glycosyltransferase involved in cell wall biosynthesis